MEENIIFKGGPTGASYIFSILLLIICGEMEAVSIILYAKIVGEGEAGTGVKYIGIFFLIVSVYILYNMISRGSQYCIITDKKLTLRKGLFSFKTIKELDIKEISKIDIKKTRLEKFFKVGDLLLTTTNEDCPELLILGFKRPEEIKEEILNCKAAMETST